ncbi:TolC family protein [Marinobacter psychrophilus]|uniref:TolC family protein n=1 Tax=Marinobacter psychrophilus TaxID=330734 RepID=UPI00069EC1F3|nr:TolC family protein [Marinobacter psychrophilus]
MFELRNFFIVCIALLLSVTTDRALAAAGPLTLDEAVQQAIANDPWLIANQQNEAAILARSVAAEVLPDPKFNVGLMNFPTDTFNYAQEPMTQISVGVSQMLPRGDTLALNSQRLRLQSHQMPLLREDRKARVGLMVTQLWLDALKASHSIMLIEENRILFEQLSDIVSSGYSSTFGQARQLDLVRAQVELDQLDERLMEVQQQQTRAVQQLGEWLVGTSSDVSMLPSTPGQSMPEWPTPMVLSQDDLTQRLLQHPSLRLIDQMTKVAQSEIYIAEQQYEPEWGLNVSYGFRGDDARGTDRPDLLSFGVSVDMPIFSSKRQDSQVQAETYEKESMRTERLLKLRSLLTNYRTLEAELQRLDQRRELYREKLLPGLQQSAEAAINAYAVDDGNFADVVQARIGELNAKLSLLSIELEHSRKIAEMHYLLVGNQRGMK